MQQAKTENKRDYFRSKASESDQASVCLTKDAMQLILAQLPMRDVVACRAANKSIKALVDGMQWSIHFDWVYPQPGINDDNVDLFQCTSVPFPASAPTLTRFWLLDRSQYYLSEIATGVLQFTPIACVTAANELLLAKNWVRQPSPLEAEESVVTPVSLMRIGGHPAKITRVCSLSGDRLLSADEAGQVCEWSVSGDQAVLLNQFKVTVGKEQSPEISGLVVLDSNIWIGATSHSVFFANGEAISMVGPLLQVGVKNHQLWTLTEEQDALVLSFYQVDYSLEQFQRGCHHFSVTPGATIHYDKPMLRGTADFLTAKLTADGHLQCFYGQASGEKVTVVSLPHPVEKVKKSAAGQFFQASYYYPDRDDLAPTGEQTVSAFANGALSFWHQKDQTLKLTCLKEAVPTGPAFVL